MSKIATENRVIVKSPPESNFINHITHIQNIPNPKQIQYMTFTHSYAWSFSKEKKFSQLKDDFLTTPSSTKYTVDINSVSTRNPAWTISKTERVVFKNNDSYSKNTGPSSFKALTGEGPAYSFGIPDDKKVIDEKLEKFINSKVDIPGPGSYVIEDKNRGPSYSFGLREKTVSRIPLKQNLPCVGSYDVRKDSSLKVPCTVFDKEPRMIKRKLTKRKLEIKPNYEILTTRTPKWSFGEGYSITKDKDKERDQIKIKRIKIRSSTPAPNSYVRTFFGKEGPSYSFSKEKYNHADDFDVAQSKKKNGPEPGKYNQLNYIPDTPSYTIGVKVIDLISKNKTTIPSAGTYKIKYDYLSNNKNLPFWSFGPKEGPTLKKDNKQEEKKSINQIEIPGPGHYNYINDSFPQGPKYSIGEVRKKKSKGEFPGPGEYNSTLSPSGNFFTFGVKGEDEHIKQVKKDNYPGPGTYNIKDAITGKTITISPIGKGDGQKGDYPGPGSYKIPTAFDYLSTSTRESGAWNPNFRYV